MRTIAPLLAALAAAFTAAPAAAFPGFYTAWQNRYATSQSGPNVLNGVGTSCQLCHAEPSGGNGWNGYGWDLRTHIQNGLTATQAIVAVEVDDSDLDPSASDNLAEMSADTQPGWRQGATNTVYYSDGSTVGGVSAPAGIQGFLDPGQFSLVYCVGDGTGNGCPCLNEGGAGQGCANSTGLGAILGVSGSNSVSAADLVLEGSNLAPSQPGLYFQGNNAVNGGIGNPFGDGLRCAGGDVRRLQVRFANGSGVSSTTANIAVGGAVSAGQTKRYQIWYRDPAGSPCGSGFNFSNGLEITWAP